MTNVLSKFKPEISRNYKKWTINECLQLQREYTLKKMSINEIALKHRRSIRAILFKLKDEFNDFNEDYQDILTNIVNSDTNNEDIEYTDSEYEDTEDEEDDEDTEDMEDEEDDEDTEDEKTQLIENYTNKYNTIMFHVLTPEDFRFLANVFLLTYFFYVWYTMFYVKTN